MIEPTPIARGKAIRYGDFPTLCDALDYAAQCETGFNYYTGKAQLKAVLSYKDLREKSIALAKRLVKFAPKNARL